MPLCRESVITRCDRVSSYAPRGRLYAGWLSEHLYAEWAFYAGGGETARGETVCAEAVFATIFLKCYSVDVVKSSLVTSCVAKDSFADMCFVKSFATEAGAFVEEFGLSECSRRSAARGYVSPVVVMRSTAVSRKVVCRPGWPCFFHQTHQRTGLQETLMFFLIGLTRSAALKLVSDTPDANGAEALRQFNVRYGNRDGQSETAVFQRLLSFSFGSKLEDVEERITDFLVLSQELESMAGGLDDQVKKHASASAAQSPTCTGADNH